METYCSRDDETRKKVPYCVESRGDDGGDVVVWCNCDGHHPVECEVQEGEVHEEEVPQELSNRPLESDHGVYYKSIHNSLDKDVR